MVVAVSSQAFQTPLKQSHQKDRRTHKQSSIFNQPSIISDVLEVVLIVFGLLPHFAVDVYTYIMAWFGSKTFEPAKDIPDLSGKVILVTGGMALLVPNTRPHLLSELNNTVNPSTQATQASAKKPSTNSRPTTPATSTSPPAPPPKPPPQSPPSSPPSPTRASPTSPST